ncbi:MAG: glycosyltransferase family 2 protein [Bacteroidaceae bacterium]|nr:glycosyltransferase family 2 protein [Bacteroidaceae bacterium]
MSNWYTKYLETYEKPLDSIRPELFNEVRDKIANLNTDQPPLASVVAIAHNEETHLLSCLHSLADNKVDFPIEILVVNNSSEDGTEKLLQDLGANYVNEYKKSPGYARQCGLDHARGKYHLCIDSDTIYPPTYIATMVKALQQKDVVCAYGLWSFIPDEKQSAFSLFCYETLRDLYLIVQQIRRPELNVRGMVFGFHTELGRKYGFRTDIIRGEDGSLALAMKPYGKLKFLLTRKVRPVTGNGTIAKDGGVMGMFVNRLRKALKGISGLFTSKEHYEDHDDNIIKGNK